MIKRRNERKTQRDAKIKFISVFAERCGFPNEGGLYFYDRREKK